MSNITMPREVVEQALAVLEAVEYANSYYAKNGDGHACCPNCNGDREQGGDQKHGHYEDCELLESIYALRAALSAAAEPARVSDKVWALDHMAGRPILVLNGCSVIEAEDAEYVLSLIRAASPSPAPAVPDDLAVISKHNETIPAAMYPADPKPEERFARQVIAAYPDHAVPDAAKPEQSALSKFVHASDTEREAVGQTVVEGAFARQEAMLVAKPETQGGRAELVERLNALAELCGMATGGWDLPDSATLKISSIASRAAALLSADPARVEPLTDEQILREMQDQCGVSDKVNPVFDYFEQGVRFAEAYHGIGKDQAS